MEVSEIVNTSLEKKILVALKADRNNIVAPLIQTSLHPSLFCRITTVHIIKNSLKIKFFFFWISQKSRTWKRERNAVLI